MEYDDQVNLYAYVGNDPVNNGDPNGTCMDRDTEGECVVRNNAGAAGASAARNLEAQVRQVDHAIRDLDPDATVRVDIGGGRMREMTGEQVSAAWARTTWTVDPDGTDYLSGYGAQMDNGRFSGTPEYLETYRTRAEQYGRDQDQATRSVVLHDFGHSTRIGRRIQNAYPNDEDFGARERATSRLGRSIGNAIGETFECATFQLGCD